MKEFKEGQKAWSVVEGEVKVLEVTSDYDRYPVSTTDGDYTKEGLLYPDSKHPSLFHSLKDCQDYFNSLKEKRTYTKWVQLHNNGYVSSSYETKKDAVLDSTSNVVECREITWEA